MSTINKYLKLKENVEDAERKANQAEGGLSQIMKQFKTEFDCTTLEAAEKKHKKLQKQAETAKEKFENEIEKFNEKWEDKLEE